MLLIHTTSTVNGIQPHMVQCCDRLCCSRFPEIITLFQNMQSDLLKRCQFIKELLSDSINFIIICWHWQTECGYSTHWLTQLVLDRWINNWFMGIFHNIFMLQAQEYNLVALQVIWNMHTQGMMRWIMVECPVYVCIELMYNANFRWCNSQEISGTFFMIYK